MRTRACSQLWIVEAVWDGRIRADERTAFERHLKTCRDCQQETEYLAQLRSDLQALPYEARTPLSTRRQKHHLLAILDASTVGAVSEGRPAARRIAWLLAATVAVVLFVVHKRSAPARAVDRTMADATIEVDADAGARWQRAADLHRVELSEGSFLLRITRQDRAARVVIAVPDGEIEDLGTVLKVDVEPDRTRSIEIVEGEVVVRFRGSTEFRLRAGDTWFATPPKPATSAAEAISTIKPHAPPPRAPLPTPTTIAAPRKQPPSPVASSTRTSGSTSLETQAAEDKAYRDVLHLLHAGKEVEARDLANEYLLRFPNGFRRIEMLDVAKSSRRP